MSPRRRCPDRTTPLALERAILHDLDKDAGARDGNAELFAVAVERALSAGGDDTLLAPGSVAFSTDGPTREWIPPASISHGRGASITEPTPGDGTMSAVTASSRPKGCLI